VEWSKSTMSKWATFNTTDAAANKGNLVINSITQDYSGEDEYKDVSYGETDSGHYWLGPVQTITRVYSFNVNSSHNNNNS
jgi:poly(3-hydroxybutyrate) depolymerase